MEADQLRYELTSQARRHGVETVSLAQRIAQLELQLAEARREADEYYKGSLQNNMEATALGQQVHLFHLVSVFFPFFSFHFTLHPLLSKKLCMSLSYC